MDVAPSQLRADSAFRILLVEDNDENRELLSEYLCGFGYQVFNLDHGATFFETLADFQPHLVLLDLKLPDIDGYTLLEQLQKCSEWQHLPVIIVSAFAFPADKQRAMSLGARRYLVKPLNLIYFKLAIQEELRSRQL